MSPRTLVTTATTLLVAAVTIFCLPLVTQAAQSVDVFRSPFLYDWGFYGFYPRTWYKSFKQSSPLLNFQAWDERCDDGGYYLFSPRGTIVSNPGPVIVDARGNLVWTSDRFGETTDVKIQTYKGEQYITFWAGFDGVRYRYGRGTYYMLDASYQIFKEIEPVGDNLRGDMHEFEITQDDTALFTVYQTIPMNLSAAGGPERGWVLDGLFQEVDIATGELLFEWRASEHVAIADTMLNPDERGAGTPTDALDFFHINSVDKDGDGNYVVSGRHTHSVLCIDGATGETVWTLGGAYSSFRDLSGGRATDFTWQHHARIVGTGTADPEAATTTLLSLFDNGKSEGTDYIGAYSRGMLIELDTIGMTARLVQEFADPSRSRLAQSQGSAQMLHLPQPPPSSDSNSNSNSNSDFNSNSDSQPHMLISYGFLPTFTEFSADGAMLCDAHFAPRLASTWGTVTSYRAHKAAWTGRPTAPPAVYLRPAERALYASWHGATEVARWALEGADWEGVVVAGGGGWARLSDKRRDAFEVAFAIRDDMPPYLRVAALDKDGEVLGRTEVLHRDRGNAPDTKTRDAVVGALGALSVLLAVGLGLRKRIRRALIRSQLVSRLVAPVVRGAWWWDRRGAKEHEVQPLYQI
ncbi:hypothetical protein SLS62_002296 [Diatrype stigma]|uniref:Arylsulfotransferase n=1 Tax=Diatrype stigma TaxID=117547 RepID=A0AAN9UUP9_9PEZI